MNKNSTRNAWIFCQAPADVLYTLSLYEKHKAQGDYIHIVVVNVVANFQFLKSLNLEATIEFLPCSGLKNPLRVLYMKFVLRVFFKKMALSSQDIVYFFSVLHDYVTSYLVQNAKGKAQVNLVDHYGYRPAESSFGVMAESLLRVVSFILNVDLRYTCYQGQRFYYIPGDFKRSEVPSVRRDNFKHYFFHPEVGAERKNILLYETDYRSAGYFQSYEKDIESVLKELAPKFNLYVKGHPRLGLSQTVVSFPRVRVIPQFIPGEFISLSDYSFILGIDSAVLAHLAMTEENVFSLLPMFSIEPGAKASLQKYLETKSENKVKFLESLKFLKS